MEPFERAVQELVERVRQEPVQAIEDYWLALVDLGVETGPDEIAATIVDHECARGDYEGCSSELEMAYTEYLGWAQQALGVARW